MKLKPTLPQSSYPPLRLLEDGSGPLQLWRGTPHMTGQAYLVQELGPYNSETDSRIYTIGEGRSWQIYVL